MWRRLARPPPFDVKSFVHALVRVVGLSYVVVVVVVDLPLLAKGLRGFWGSGSLAGSCRGFAASSSYLLYGETTALDARRLRGLRSSVVVLLLLLSLLSIVFAIAPTVKVVNCTKVV